MEKANQSYIKALDHYNNHFRMFENKMNESMSVEIKSLEQDVNMSLQNFYMKFILQTMSSIRSM